MEKTPNDVSLFHIAPSETELHVSFSSLKVRSISFQTNKMFSPMQFATVEGFGVKVNTCRIPSFCTVNVDFSSQLYPRDS